MFEMLPMYICIHLHMDYACIWIMHAYNIPMEWMMPMDYACIHVYTCNTVIASSVCIYIYIYIINI